jgi:hypothetical protein
MQRGLQPQTKTVDTKFSPFSMKIGWRKEIPKNTNEKPSSEPQTLVYLDKQWPRRPLKPTLNRRSVAFGLEGKGRQSALCQWALGWPDSAAEGSNQAAGAAAF